MSNDPRTVTLVVMGVSGVGKSSVAAELVARTGWAFVEGDDLHPESNRRRMASDHPLDDDDRRPWLRRVASWIGELEAAGRSGIVTCSALKRSYRDLLRGGHPSVRFVHLLTPPELIARRLTARRSHYMPPSLLDSQLATLEDLQPDEAGTCVDATGDPPTVAERALHELGLDEESRAAGGGPP